MVVAAAKKRPEPYAPYILIVDDESRVRQLFARILEDAGYLVSEAENGRAAARLCEDRFFDVIVSDLSMPDMDGLEMLGLVRGELPNIKVVLISGFIAGSQTPISRLGADAVLPKPLAKDRLLKTVCDLLADR